MFVTLLIRKHGSGHSQVFEILTANTFDDIENELVSKEGEEIGGKKYQYHQGFGMRRLKFNEPQQLGYTLPEKDEASKSHRKLDGDDWDTSQEEQDEDETKKKSKKKIEKKLKIRKKKTRKFK